MRRVFLITGLMCFIAAAAFSGGRQEEAGGGQQPAEAPAVQESMDLSYAYGASNAGPFAEANQWFCDEISRRTDSKIN